MPPLQKAFQDAIDLVAQLDGERPRRRWFRRRLVGARAWRPPPLPLRRLRHSRMQRPAWAVGDPRRPQARHQGHGLSRARHGTMVLWQLRIPPSLKGSSARSNRSARNFRIAEPAPSFLGSRRAGRRLSIGAGGHQGQIATKDAARTFYRNAVWTFRIGWATLSGVKSGTTDPFGPQITLMIFRLWGIPGVRLDRVHSQAESNPPVAFSRFCDLLRQRRSNKANLVPKRFFHFFRDTGRAPANRADFWWRRLA